MRDLFYQEGNGMEDIHFSEEEVEDFLREEADRFSTTSTDQGIRLDWDGKGQHTKKLPDKMHQYVREVDGAKFMANRDNQRRREER